MRIIGLSSAGNTRGLIEAARPSVWTTRYPRLPRGIPAASLKRLIPPSIVSCDAVSSAGNTRGLIEAVTIRA